MSTKTNQKPPKIHLKIGRTVQTKIAEMVHNYLFHLLYVILRNIILKHPGRFDAVNRGYIHKNWHRPGIGRDGYIHNVKGVLEIEKAGQHPGRPRITAPVQALEKEKRAGC